MSARDRIFARIRAAQRKAPQADAEEAAALRAYLAEHPPGPRPHVAGDLRALFRARALALSSTIGEVDRLGDVPRAAGEYLRGSKLPLSAACWPQLAALEWSSAGISVRAGAARASDLVGITGAFCGIAETGTLLLTSGRNTPATVSLLPETHIAILDARRIVADMEEAWRRLRAETAGMPRAIHFVSGPSRTADIEQTVTLGAHGPYRVHIILVHATGAEASTRDALSAGTFDGDAVHP